MDFQSELNDRVCEAEHVLEKYMPYDYEDEMQSTVIDAMHYTVFAGGKRIRPVLMKAVYDMLGGSGGIIEPFMAGIEMIHTYSLIHDDLPALDNDDYRRGKKTCHVVYGEAMAVLTGDALLNYAYETAVKAYSIIESMNISDIARELIYRKNVDKAVSILARNPGIYGMIGGQVVDVEMTGHKLNKEQLEFIYRNKTGALIDAAMTIGAVLAGAKEDVINDIRTAAYDIGLAFQIQDDILDETADFEELGKPIHSDMESGKITYVTIHGMDNAHSMVSDLSRRAVERVTKISGDSDFLAALIEYLIDRKK